jgi:putative drug exporter of the RND superfamily
VVGLAPRRHDKQALVVLDTFVVRSVLVTALNLDVGRWIWWPSSLHRKRDVELGAVEEEAAAVTH